MGPWEILGIEPTDDVRAIKRAYAKKLKQHRPEEDPQGFQQLNEAYQFVVENLDYLLSMEQAEPQNEAESEKDSEVESEVERKVARKVASEAQPSVQPQSDIVVDDSQPLPQLQPYEEIFAKFREMLLKPMEGEWDEQQREQRCVEQWREFLSQDEFYHIDYKNEISIDIFGQLIQFHKQRNFINLPLEVKTMLMEVFLWQDQELELCRYFHPEDVDAVLRQMRAGQQSYEQKYVPQMAAEDIKIDPIVFKMLAGVVCLLMALVLVL